MSDREQDERPPADETAQLRTFLIADVRGYTLFTQERGDEAAAKLAARFAGVVRESIEARGGSLIELRGDEALVVFSSARQAIRAAVELQDRLVAETEADPSLPLPVGIGLDAGEAVPVEGGYRGGALNLAARLCGIAGPAEVLASQEVVHLARRVEGVRYEDRGEVHLKGMADPVRVVRVSSERGDVLGRIAPFVSKPMPVPRAARRRLARPRVMVLIVAVLVLAAGVPIALRLRETGAVDPLIQPESVAVIDGESGRVLGDLPIGSSPSAIAAEPGAVWVASAAAGIVTRIDPSTRRVTQTIQVPGTPVSLAVGAGAVWVVNADGPSVLQINPGANRVVNSITVGNGPIGVAVGAGGVWVANSLDDTVTRIDPQAGVVVKDIAVGSRPAGVVVSGSSVWVTNSSDGTVVQIDAGTNSVTRTTHVGNGPAGLAADGRSIWVANSLDGTASRVDAGSGSVIGTVPVGDGPSGVAVAGGSAWVANRFGGTLSRIERGGLTRSVPLGNHPEAVAAAGSDLWVAVSASGSARRGGTLLVEATESPDSLDPAVAYSFWEWPILVATNDGLVAFRRVGGPDGATIVPDLAIAVPAPTDGGKTYTFQLRSGIRYSNGRPVRAGDFRYALERGFRSHSPTVYYQGIVGGAACARSPASCDLSQGVLTDDRAGTVTFHLTAPDAEFLYKLALPFADAVPPGTPDATGSTTVAATGPYQIKSTTPGKGKERTVVLVRNPMFHEWSAAAQPDGYPDTLVWTYGVDAQQLVTDIEQGRADVSLDTPPPARLQELTTRYTNQVHTYTQPWTNGITLNTRVPPFDDVRVRRAVNYAFDRGQAARDAQPATPTCQFLPPNFPSYRLYCPYTLSPTAAGGWTAPDVPRARQLVAASHTGGMKVTVWATSAFPSMVSDARLLTSALNQLGYRASLRTIASFVKYFSYVGNSENRVQASGNGWISDYPAPSNFMDIMRCSSFKPRSNQNQNFPELCDHELDGRIERAVSVQTTDPPAAYALWAAIDRRVTDIAPWVFTVNPSGLDFVAPRVGNYQHNPQWGILVDQLWVK